MFETVAAAKKGAADLSIEEAIGALQAELASEETRKGVVDALVGAHLADLVSLADVGATPVEAAPLVEAAPAPAAPAPAAPTPAPTAPLRIPLGNIPTAGPTLIVADCDVVDGYWVHKTYAQKGYIVDIEGEQAEYLANRQRAYPFKPIGPNRYRVMAGNSTQAGAVQGETERLIKQEGWNTTVAINSSGTSKVRAGDAAHDDGAGIVNYAALVIAALDTRGTGSVPVAGVVGADGRITQLIIG